MARIEDLSGEYCYIGPDLNVRAWRRGVESVPFLAVRNLGTPTRVSVEASADRVVFAYTDVDGVEQREVYDLKASGAVWEGSALSAPSRGDGAYLSRNWSTGQSAVSRIGSTSRSSRLFRLEDGRLVLSDSTRDQYFEGHDGQGNFFRMESAVAVLLAPFAGDCGAGEPTGPLPPWFGSGIDLRDPACAARLEEALGAILVRQGVGAGVAEALARETLESLRSDPGTEFGVESPGARFRFSLAKTSSGCVLRLYEREIGRRRYANTFTYIEKERLTGCACNP